MYDYRQAIDRIMQREVDEGQIAGAAYLLIQGGRERYFSACGYADRERKTLIKRDTIFRLFSMTKPITAAAAMLLVERGAGSAGCGEPLHSFFWEDDGVESGWRSLAGGAGDHRV